MTTRPTSSPSFATTTNYPAGGSPWSNTPARVSPSGAVLVQGLTPQTDVAAQHVNFLVGNHGDWITYLDTAAGVGAFGSGSDGAVDLNGTNTYPGIQLSGGSYTLLRDVNVTNMTIRAGVTLFGVGPGFGFRIYGTGTLTVENTGQIVCSQVAPSPGPTAGNAPGPGSIGGAGKGANGNNGAGSAGTSVTNSLGGNGGAGGVGTGGGAGAAGTATVPLATSGNSGASFGMLMGFLVGTNSGTALLTAMQGGAGGGSGGGTGAQPGGAGGSGGGVMMISFRSIVLANTTALSSPGNAGDPSAASGGAGGGGGGGGYIRIVCVDLSVATGTLSGATNCPGGAGGASNGAGTAGSAGSSGTVELVLVSNNTFTAPASPGHVESGFATVTTGTGSGHEYVDITFATPFIAATGASGYKINVELNISDNTAPNVGWTIRNKTINGARIQFTGAFNGEVRWKAD